MPILNRRPKRYVPRHSTREPFRAWDSEEIIDLTALEKSTSDVLQDVLVGLDSLDEKAAAKL